MMFEILVIDSDIVLKGCFNDDEVQAKRQTTTTTVVFEHQAPHATDEPGQLWPHLASSSLLKQQPVIVVEQEHRERAMKQSLRVLLVEAVGVPL